MTSKVIVFVCLFLSAHLGHSQLDTSSGLIQGDSLFSTGNVKAALVYFKRSSEHSLANEQFEDYFKAEVAINECHLAIGELDSILTRTYPLLKRNEETIGRKSVYAAQMYTQLAKANRFYDKPDTALSLINLAAGIIAKTETKDPDLLEDYYLTKGIIYAMLLPMDSAVHYTQLALDSRLERFDDNHEKVAEAYSNLGIIQLNNRQPVLALEHVEKAHAIRLQLKSKPSLSYAANLKNMGNTYFVLAEYQKALEVYRKAWKMRAVILDKNHLLLADIYQNLGNAHNFLTNYDSALHYHRLAVDVYQTDLEKFGPFLGRVTNNIGYVFLRKREYETTKTYFDSALQYNRKYLGARSNRVIRNYINLCRVTNGLNQYSEMASYAHQAILANTVNEIQDTSILVTPTVNHFVTQEYVIGGLNMKGLAFENLYYKTNDTTHLNAAIDAYKEACKVLDQLKSTLTSDADKITFYKSAKTVFEHSLDVLLESYMRNKQQHHLSDAFEVLQLFKNSTLVEANSNLYEALENDLPAKLLEREIIVLENISETKTAIVKDLKSANPDQDKIRTLRSKLFDLNRLHDAIKRQIKNYNIDFHNIKYGSKDLYVEDLQQQLDSSSMILEYFVGDASTFCFLTTTDQFEVYKLSDSKDLTAKIDTFNQKLTHQQIVDLELAQEISKQIFQPLSIDKDINQLIIIPDGALWKLNFDLLPLKASPTQKVIDLYATSYAYSSHLLVAPKKEKSFKKNTLAFSFSETTEDDIGKSIQFDLLRTSEAELPGSSQEIKAISKLRDGDYMYGKEASESNFKKFAKDYTILHLAVHGQIDHENPSQSSLSFFHTGDSKEDGLLHNFEIYNLKLNSSLAVLSACNTGSGQIRSSEGTLSIGRAFAYAGIESLLLSRTEVSDAISPIIMKYFYEGLNAGKRKSEALREAKLKFLKTDADKISSNPYYWSSFYILGDDAPIPDSRAATNNSIILFVGSLLVLLLFALLIRKKLLR